MEPAHLQGVINGLPSSSVSSKHILQALPLSMPLKLLSFKPPIILSFGFLIPLKIKYVKTTEIKLSSIPYLVKDI